MSMQETFHRAHVERMRRFTPKPQPKPPVVVAMPPPPVDPEPPVICERAWAVVLDPLLPPRKFPRVHSIQKVVAFAYNVTVLDMLSPRRTWNVVRPRHVAMYLCRTMTPHTLPEIGRRFGDRDHTSVLHAFRRISDLIARKPDQAEFIEELKAKLTIKVPD
jgi:hypothetical protein